MKLIDTGCPTVDQMGELDFTGNVVPQNWLKEITKKNDRDEDTGKAYLLAIAILSELVYWYRPKEERDERTGQVLEYTRKFKYDLLQKSYDELAEEYGESKRSVKAAMDRLEELKLIRREFRNLKFTNGKVVLNVMYVDLNVERIKAITFEKKGKKEEKQGRNSGAGVWEIEKVISTSGQFVQKFDGADNPDWGEKIGSDGLKMPVSPVNSNVTKKCNISLQKNVGYVAEKCNISPQKNEGYVAEKCNISPQKNAGYPAENCNLSIQKSVTCPVENCGTNTEITTENTTENISHVSLSHPIPSDQIGQDGIRALGKKKSGAEIRAVREDIRNRISFDALAADDRINPDILRELVEIMVEVYITGADVTIGGNPIPYEFICERFDQYDQFMMEYVLLSLRKNETKVGNVKKYLLATLYNAPTTMINYYRQEVQHDFGA